MVHEIPDAKLGPADIASDNRISIKGKVRFRRRKDRARFLRWSVDHVPCCRPDNRMIAAFNVRVDKHFFPKLSDGLFRICQHFIDVRKTRRRQDWTALLYTVGAACSRLAKVVMFSASDR